MFSKTHKLLVNINMTMEDDYSCSWRVLQGMVSSVSEGTVKAYGFNRSAIGIGMEVVLELSRKSDSNPFVHVGVFGFVQKRHNTSISKDGNDESVHFYNFVINYSIQRFYTLVGKPYIESMVTFNREMLKDKFSIADICPSDTEYYCQLVANNLKLFKILELIDKSFDLYSVHLNSLIYFLGGEEYFSRECKRHLTQEELNGPICLEHIFEVFKKNFKCGKKPLRVLDHDNDAIEEYNPFDVSLEFHNLDMVFSAFKQDKRFFLKYFYDLQGLLGFYECVIASLTLSSSGSLVISTKKVLERHRADYFDSDNTVCSNLVHTFCTNTNPSNFLVEDPDLQPLKVVSEFVEAENLFQALVRRGWSRFPG